ncbi:MAG: hypothetical protein JW787_13830 [Sedimentisphaerales bacterium]|nr:hypothetical protein [Sedimentisphaerales bacterium]
MVKTLHITSFVAVLLAIAISAFPVFYRVKGVKNDENIEKFLNSPDIIEKFKEVSGQRTQTPANQVHPLVQQSELFAKIINPPKPVQDPQPNMNKNSKIMIEPSKTLTPKFKVIITSVCEQNTELSQALIDEPGKGKYWVRQSSIVNHQIIEQVNDGIVIVRNGDELFELKIEERKFAPSAVPATGRISPAAKSSSTSNPAPNRPPRIITPPSVTVNTAPKTENDPEKVRKIEELYEKLKIISSAEDADPNNTPSMEERALRMQAVITEFRNSNMNISEEEAQKLAELGKLFENIPTSESDN